MREDWGPGSGRGGFHYSRRERLSRPGAPRQRPPDRGLPILLINVVTHTGLGPRPGERAYVRFRLEGEGDEVPVSGEVPAGWGHRTVLRVVLVAGAAAPGVRAEVRIGEQSLVLHRRLAAEGGR